MTWELYNQLVHNGDFLKTRQLIDANKCAEEIRSFDWVKYNPAKPDILRDGLSVTSLDGGLSGYPDLHSLKEVYEDTGESYAEEDFATPTEVYKTSEQTRLACEPWKQWLTRTHFLRLPSGGYFPDHVDGTRVGAPTSFRLIVPIKNCNPPKFNFLLDIGARYEVLNWEMGRVYFLNTSKRHVLFNASQEDSIWLVMNIIIDEDSVQKLRYEVY